MGMGKKERIPRRVDACQIVHGSDMSILNKTLLIFLFCTLMTCAKNQPNESQTMTLPPKIPIPEPMHKILKDVISSSPDSYFPSKSKIAEIDVHTPEEAYRQITILYPEKAKMVECWTVLNNHFVFSLGQTKKIKNAYLYILYVPIGGRKFGYYWPHT
jgi:hypothetical protein